MTAHRLATAVIVGRLLLGLWLLCGALPGPVSAQTLMRVSTLPDPDPATEVAERVMREAYARLGIALQVMRMPAERSLVSANVGDTDGELYRRAGIDASYTQLVRVPVALMHYEIVAFSLDSRVVLQGWESLRPYRLGFVRGIKVIEENTGGMAVEPVTTLRQAFVMLERGRTDLVLANRLSGLAALRAADQQTIQVLTPALERFPVFHYLNVKHAQLLPRLSEVLRDMEQSKRIARIQDEVLSGK
jgi:polar amino acid transport system substrate-binding protein